MSSGGSSSTTAAWPPPGRPSLRGKMRNGTFVIPRTGERSRRQFTLRAPRNRSYLEGFERRASSASASAAAANQHLREATRNIKKKAVVVWRWLQSSDGQQVLKCTLAYLLGSTATLWPPLSNFLGNRDGKHIVATLTVYFHPARTAGSMLEAVIIAIIAVAYAELICVLSMVVAMASRAISGSAAPAHVIVLIFCIGGGLGLLGWTKQRLNKPLVNTASTLASIAIISVITKEESVHDGYFSNDKIIQMLKMLVLGISFTVAVNLLVWRVSARRVLRKSIVNASVALSDRLSFITSGFLNGSEDDINSPDYAQATTQYNSAYAQMTVNLREAKLEHYFLGREKIYALDKRLVKSLEALSQSIGGLRSALQTQFTLLKEGQAPGTASGTASGTQSLRPLSPEPTARVLRALSFMDNAKDRLSIIEEDEDEPHSPPFNHSCPMFDKSPIFRVPSDIFALFLALLGPSMKSLAYTLSETLRENPFGPDPERQVTVNDQLRESLRDALSLYNSARGSALHELYRSIELGRARSEEIQADIEEVAAACGHFSFSLQAVAEEMDSYLDVLEALKYSTETQGRSWEWVKFWRRWRWTQDHLSPDAESEPLLPKKVGVKGRKKSPAPKGIPKAIMHRKDTFNWDASPEVSAFVRSASQMLLKILRFFARDDVLFGIKVGIGALLWAMFAFIPATRPIYQRWRGEWGLLSYMIVVGMTTGASNTTGSSRFVGTLIGGTCACVSWQLSQANPWLLAVCSSLVALGNFYLILVMKEAPLGRISLLAYNVIVLYAYSLSQNVDDDDDDEGGLDPLIFDITYHRVLAVTLGILWGILVCRLLWPISGRQKFREGLAVLYLQLGLIWKRGPLSVLIQSNNTLDFMLEGEQLALRRYVFKLESLRDSAKSEFELRGPFPNAAYGRIMRSTKYILDGFYAMRLITQRRQDLSEGERALLTITAAERVLLCQRICHVFQVLASSIMLEYPLTDAVPTIDRNRDQLLNKIYRFRKDHMEMSLTNDDDDAVQTMAEERDYALLYAYTLVTAQVAAELKKVTSEIEGLFGVLHPDELILE